MGHLVNIRALAERGFDFFFPPLLPPLFSQLTSLPVCVYACVCVHVRVCVCVLFVAFHSCVLEHAGIPDLNQLCFANDLRFCYHLPGEPEWWSFSPHYY